MRYDGSPYFEPSDEKSSLYEVPDIDKRQAFKVGKWLQNESMLIINILFDQSK